MLFISGQHRTIPALRLKHRSGGCGTSLAVSALRAVSLKKVTHNRMRSQCHFAEIYRKFAIEIIFLI